VLNLKSFGEVLNKEGAEMKDDAIVPSHFYGAIKSPHKAGMLSCFIVIICCIQSSPVQLLLKQVS